MIAQANRVPGWRLRQSFFSRDKFCVAQPYLKPHGPASGSTLSFSPLTTVIIFPISFTHKERDKILVNQLLPFL